MRWLLGVVGIAVAAYGGWLLVSREDDLVSVGTWLVAGVVLHDAVLATVVILLGALAVRVVPEVARVPVVVGVVVLGSVTLLAVPVLGRFGASEANPTILDRDYTAGWLALLGLTASAVTIATLVRSRGRSGRR